MKRFIMAVTLVLMFSALSLGAETKTIVAAADPWPPFVDQKHPKDGLSLEIIRAAYKTQGYKVKMEYVPWARAEASVKSGAYDILPDVWMTDARKKELMFSKPYVSNKIKFICLKKNPFEYDGIESLKGRIIGTVRGYGYSDEFIKSPDFRRDEAADFMTSIKKIISKRIELTLEDEIVAKTRIAQENPKLFEQLKFTKNSFSVNDLHIASAYKNKRHVEIIDAFNKGLEIIKSNGTFEKILISYGIK